MYRKLSAVIILLCISGTASAAVSVTFQEGFNGYAGTLDTQFSGAAPSTVLGEEDNISIDEDDGGFPTQGALRFTNIFQGAGGPIPTSNVTIGFAELDIFAVDPGNVGAIIGFHRVLAASPWDENSTWSSEGGALFPDGTGVLAKPILADDVESLSTPDFVVPEPAVDELRIKFNVTDAVQDWVDGAANLGWAIKQDQTGGWDFSASEEFPEDFERPKLTVVYYQSGLLADIDGDLDVDPIDYGILLDNLASHLDGPVAIGSGGDLDFDRDIDLDDFGIFKSEFPGGAGALEAALAAVPEPSTALLGLVAVCGLAFGRRRISS